MNTGGFIVLLFATAYGSGRDTYRAMSLPTLKAHRDSLALYKSRDQLRHARAAHAFAVYSAAYSGDWFTVSLAQNELRLKREQMDRGLTTYWKLNQEVQRRLLK